MDVCLSVYLSVSALIIVSSLVDQANFNDLTVASGTAAYLATGRVGSCLSFTAANTRFNIGFAARFSCVGRSLF
jgi:hypothetical protein